MQHTNIFSVLSSTEKNKLLINATGQFYTSKCAAMILYEGIFEKLKQSKNENIKIADPFAGDGRLITWFLEAWKANDLPPKKWDVYLFDVNNEGLITAEKKLEHLKDEGIDLTYSIVNSDTFSTCKNYFDFFDCVITNPPWETIKPDLRELNNLNYDDRNKYIVALKAFDDFLAREFPLSQPKKKFAGWGTNLSRVGAEVCLDICKSSGLISILLPASFFADEQSYAIRKGFLSQGKIDSISYFPAEAKLFGSADVASCAMLFTKSKSNEDNMLMSVFSAGMTLVSSDKLNSSDLTNPCLSIPVSLGAKAVLLLKKLQGNFQTWGELEDRGEIWAGREVDETGSKSWLKESIDAPLFIKGRMIGRYCFLENPVQSINKENFVPPASYKFERIAWRDVSRPSQKRRVISSIIPKMTVAGNSLGIVYFKNNSKESLYALLGIINSLCFEFQVRAFLATGHVSLSALRRTSIPNQNDLYLYEELISLVDVLLNKKILLNEFKIESLVARDIYGLSFDEYDYLINSFVKLTKLEKDMLLEEYKK